MWIHLEEKGNPFYSLDEGIQHRFRADKAIYLLLVKLQAFHYMLSFLWKLRGKHIKCVEQENRRETVPEEMKLSGMTRKYIDLSLGSVNLVELCKARKRKEEDRKNGKCSALLKAVLFRPFLAPISFNAWTHRQKCRASFDVSWNDSVLSCGP